MRKQRRKKGCDERAIGGENSEQSSKKLKTKKKLKTQKTFQSPDPAKHYGLTRVLDAPVTLANADKKDFVFQYDVKFVDGLTCGGEEVDDFFFELRGREGKGTRERERERERD